MAVAAAHYVYNWGHFPGGVFMLSLATCKDVAAMKLQVWSVLGQHIAAGRGTHLLLLLDDVEVIRR